MISTREPPTDMTRNRATWPLLSSARRCAVGLAVLATVLLAASLLPGAAAPAQAQKAEGKTEVKPVAITPPSQRPALTAEAVVEDSSGDGTLEAGEAATLRVRIANEGKGPARGVEVWATPTEQAPGLRFGGDPVRSDTGAVRLGTVSALAPGASEAVTGRLRATDQVSGEARSYSIHLREKRGFVPEAPTTVAVQTQAYRPPVLEVTGTEVTGGAGEGMVLPGRASTVRVQVQNAGPRPARALAARVEVGSGGVLQGASERELGRLAPGDATAIPVSVTASQDRKSVV